MNLYCVVLHPAHGKIATSCLFVSLYTFLFQILTSVTVAGLKCFVCDNYAGHPSDSDLWTNALGHVSQPPCYKFKDTAELTPYILDCDESVNSPPACYAAIPAVDRPDDTHSTRSCFQMPAGSVDGQCYKHPRYDDGIKLYSCGCSTDFCNVYDKMLLDNSSNYNGVLTSDKTDSAKYFKGTQYVVPKPAAPGAAASNATTKKPAPFIPVAEDVPQSQGTVNNGVASADNPGNQNKLSSSSSSIRSRIKLELYLALFVSVLAVLSR